MIQKKGNKAIFNVTDEHYTSFPGSISTTITYDLQGFTILDDCWVGEIDKILVDNEGNEYNILEFKEAYSKKRYADPVYTLEIQYDGCVVDWKHSCVKLDKPVKEGTYLYIKYKSYEI